MQRRQALRLLARLPVRCMPVVGAFVQASCAAPGPRQTVAPSRASTAGGAQVLVWGPDGAWIVDAMGRQRLPAGLPPVAVAGALWTADGEGLVQRWQGPAAGAEEPRPWRVVAAHTIGAPAHALAASADGRHALVAHREQLTLLDANARPLRHYAGRDLARTRHGAAQTLLAHAGRRSFVAAWPALGEWWEIPLDPDAPPIFDGLVHDYRLGEALPNPGYLGVRRVPLGQPLPRAEFADARVPWLAGRVDGGVAIVHLDVRQRIATLALPAAQPAGGTLLAASAGWHWWLPAGDTVFVVDAARWVVVHRLPAPPGLRGLRTVGSSVWAFGTHGLKRWHDGAWRALAGAAGPVTAFETRPRERVAWLATSAPATLLQFDAVAGAVARLPLPEGARIAGLAALDSGRAP